MIYSSSSFNSSNMDCFFLIFSSCSFSTSWLSFTFSSICSISRSNFFSFLIFFWRESSSICSGVILFDIFISDNLVANASAAAELFFFAFDEAAPAAPAADVLASCANTAPGMTGFRLTPDWLAFANCAPFDSYLYEFFALIVPFTSSILYN